jgi:hypothetical protein
MKDNYVLGLDISTSVIGLCVFKNKEFFLMTHLDLKKINCIFKKAETFKLFLNDILSKNNIKLSEIYIEQVLQSFSKGFSSSNTIIQLARFNGIVSNISYEVSGIVPVYLNVNSARKSLGIKIDKNSSKDKKEQVVDWVSLDLPEYEWPKKTVSRGVNKGLVKLEHYCYDIADAYVICKAGTINDLRDNQKN